MSLHNITFLNRRGETQCTHTTTLLPSPLLLSLSLLLSSPPPILLSLPAVFASKKKIENKETKRKNNSYGFGLFPVVP